MKDICQKSIAETIKAEGTLKQQEQVAARIYKGFGERSTVSSAITCRAGIAAEASAGNPALADDKGRLIIQGA